MTESEVRMRRFLQQAYASTCGVALDVKARVILLFPGGLADVGETQVFDDVRSARCWLQVYTQCGAYGRRCSLSGCPCCRSVAEELLASGCSH